MNLVTLPGGQHNPLYREVRSHNSARYLHFLSTLIMASISIKRPLLAEWHTKAINYQAIVMLHKEAGEYRQVEVEVGNHIPPVWQEVPRLMHEFVEYVNTNWTEASDLHLAAYSIWRINHIHPFINGNGHTARAVCYYILCMKAGGLLIGSPSLPELLAGPEHARYIGAIRIADETNDLIPLMSLIGELVRLQLGSS